MKKKKRLFCVFKRKIIDDISNIKIIIHVAYCCFQNNEETFKKSEMKVRNNILKFYRKSRFVIILFN